MPLDYARWFPSIGTINVDFRETSLPHYHNCIAYAAGDNIRAWWPDKFPPNSRDYWPDGVPHDDESLDTFLQAFATIDYKPCKDGKQEVGYEKVAFYATGNEVKHAARQQLDGSWRSKLGKQEDIEHRLEGLEGDEYGYVVGFVKRSIQGYLPPRVNVARRVMTWTKRLFAKNSFSVLCGLCG